ncbi:hypothetical protein Nepgr_003681 [Nepenthes gracilis]|uniref:5'-deoxynucleotidase n=1 Tax=Nepenthes gracilis TaxID=150966 RepID=A0AAD3XE29_NEPGR|nr:hypothetical protein Nepgr_003681 [Nepenthes gracilis]
MSAGNPSLSNRFSSCLPNPAQDIIDRCLFPRSLSIFFSRSLTKSETPRLASFCFHDRGSDLVSGGDGFRSKMLESSSDSLLPSSSAIDFLTLCHRLKTTKRKGWINHGIKGPESIADHMYRMALMGLIVGDLPGVNRERCIKIAIVHDIAEAIVGDITPSDGIPKEEKSRREQAALNEMCEVLGGGMRAEEIKQLWAEYENNSSLEANLVKDFDKVEMILQALEYETEHGKVLDEFFQSTAGKFQTEVGKSWAAEIISRRNSSSMKLRSELPVLWIQRAFADSPDSGELWGNGLCSPCFTLHEALPRGQGTYSVTSSGFSLSLSSASSFLPIMAEDCNALIADCIVISCCCQCLILRIVVLIFTELPLKMARKTREYAKRKLGRRRGEVMEENTRGRYPNEFILENLGEALHEVMTERSDIHPNLLTGPRARYPNDLLCNRRCESSNYDPLEAEGLSEGKTDCMNEVEKVLEELSKKGEYAFGSFWGRDDETGTSPACNAKEEFGSTNFVRYHLIQAIGPFSYSAT